MGLGSPVSPVRINPIRLRKNDALDNKPFSRCLRLSLTNDEHSKLMTKPSEREVSHSLPVADGLSIRYRLWRVPKQPRPVIVLLHGVASNISRWSEFVEQTTLKDTWDILRIDLRGHGEPLWRGKLNIDVWCQDLLRVLDHEHYTRALLIGHSLGVQIAINFASCHPSRVIGLVLIDPIQRKALVGHLRLASRLTPLLRLAVIAIRMLNRVGIYRRHIPQRDLRALDKKMRETLLATGQLEKMVDRYSSPWLDLQHFPTANFLQEIMEMVRPLPPLSSIVAPVLVLFSKSATYADPKVSPELIAQFKNATTVVIDAYHWPLTEKPVEIRRAIDVWCARLA